MGGDVLARHLGEHALRHAEERADPVEDPRGALDQRAVAEHEDVLPGEHRVEMRELLPVTPEGGVVPEVRPAGRDPALLLGAGRDEVTDGIQPRGPQMRPVPARPLHWIPHQHDTPGAGDPPLTTWLTARV